MDTTGSVHRTAQQNQTQLALLSGGSVFVTATKMWTSALASADHTQTLYFEVYQTQHAILYHAIDTPPSNEYQ